MLHHSAPATGTCPVQHADRRGEEREAVDEIGGAVDRVDRPDEIAFAARPLLRFLAQYVVARESFGEAGADQGLDIAVDLGNRVAQQRRFGFRGDPLIFDGLDLAQGGLDLRSGEAGELDRGRLDPGEQGRAQGGVFDERHRSSPSAGERRRVGRGENQHRLALEPDDHLGAGLQPAGLVIDPHGRLAARQADLPSAA